MVNSKLKGMMHVYTCHDWITLLSAHVSSEVGISNLIDFEILIEENLHM